MQAGAEETLLVLADSYCFFGNNNNNKNVLAEQRTHYVERELHLQLTNKAMLVLYIMSMHPLDLSYLPVLVLDG